MHELLIDYMRRFSDMDMKTMKAIVEKVPIQTYSKGTILLEQGTIPDKCYFVLKGCVRQYGVDELGREITYNFYTEEQAVTIFNQHSMKKASKYYLSCLEESILVVGDLDSEQGMYDSFDGLESVTRRMMEMFMGEMQDEHAMYLSASPEERYQLLLKKRPDLITRVPQHQLASYLGITPESLSRIKKRINKSKLKLVD